MAPLQANVRADDAPLKAEIIDALHRSGFKSTSHGILRVLTAFARSAEVRVTVLRALSVGDTRIQVPDPDHG